MVLPLMIGVLGVGVYRITNSQEPSKNESKRAIPCGPEKN